MPRTEERKTLKEDRIENVKHLLHQALGEFAELQKHMQTRREQSEALVEDFISDMSEVWDQ